MPFMQFHRLEYRSVSAAIVLLFLIAVSSAFPSPRPPLSGSRQLVLVIAETDSAISARMETFSRAAARGAWRSEAAWPVVLGKTGLAWGRGLHHDRDRLPAKPVKREGDGKAPAGAFSLLRAFGYAPTDSVRTRFPYTRTTPDLICIDDVRSEFYNLVVNLAEKGLDRKNLPSHEEMLRDDDLYRWVITVGHNINPPEKGAGSCIFLHVWRGPDSFTAGCTAMSGENIVHLLGWLDPSRHPVLVQLDRADYMRLRSAWGLPGR
jgi:L,D-peptidoglycan transpeptidase YkuD (ErfK/YbiS/YcfS/YnhG family)